jgi:hypothetical protein
MPSAKGSQANSFAFLIGGFANDAQASHKIALGTKGFSLDYSWKREIEPPLPIGSQSLCLGFYVQGELRPNREDSQAANEQTASISQNSHKKTMGCLGNCLICGTERSCQACRNKYKFSADSRANEPNFKANSFFTTYPELDYPNLSSLPRIKLEADEILRLNWSAVMTHSIDSGVAGASAPRDPGFPVNTTPIIYALLCSPQERECDYLLQTLGRMVEKHRAKARNS